MSNPNPSNLLAECLSLGQEQGMLTNIIPSESLEEMLVEKSFIKDMGEQYASLVIGSSKDIETVKARIGQQLIDYIRIDA